MKGNGWTASALRPLLLLVVVTGAVGAADAPPPAKDEIRRFVRAYIEAGNGDDTSAVMEMVSRKPEVSIAAMGVVNRGWETIRSQVEKVAVTPGTHKVTLDSMDVSLLGETYALVVASVSIDLALGDTQAQMGGAMTLVLEKSAGKWKVLHEHDSLQFPQADLPEGSTE